MRFAVCREKVLLLRKQGVHFMRRASRRFRLDDEMPELRSEKGQSSKLFPACQAQLLPLWHNRRLLALHGLSPALPAPGGSADRPERLPARPHSHRRHDHTVRLYVHRVAEEGAQRLFIKVFDNSVNKWSAMAILTMITFLRKLQAIAITSAVAMAAAAGGFFALGDRVAYSRESAALSSSPTIKVTGDVTASLVPD